MVARVYEPPSVSPPRQDRSCEPAIEVDRLSKHYGAHAAVSDVSFAVQPGEVVGFLGQNGAGKSTTLKILAGYLGATSGRARVAGHDVVLEPYAAKMATGYMPESVPLYPEMRVREYLRFRAELKGVGRAGRASAIDRAIELSRTKEVADTRIEVLSKGFRQRVGLADALVGKPKVLILDEPTAGMDPNQIREVRALIANLGGEHTILLSTHILSEVEASCARVVVIDKGRIVAEGTPSELGALRRPPRIELLVRGVLSLVEQTLTAQQLDFASREQQVEVVKCEVVEGQDDMIRILLGCDRDHIASTTEAVVAALVGAGVSIREVGSAKASLEEVFTQLTAHVS